MEGKKPTSFSDQDIARERLSAADVRVSTVLASRSALRAVPLIFDARLHEREKWENLVLQLFHANFCCWSSGHGYATSRDPKTRLIEARRRLLKLSSSKIGHGQVAVLATSEAVMCALCGISESAVAATHATQTVISASYASNARRQALLADYQLFMNGIPIVEIFKRPLWYVGQSGALMAYWNSLESALRELDHDWDVWINWYIDRVYGRSIDENAIYVWDNLPSAIWSANPQVTNAEIKRALADPLRYGRPTEKEPELEPGPEFDISEEGLSLKTVKPILDPLDIETQQELYERLRRLAPMLAEASQKDQNLHRGLGSDA